MKYSQKENFEKFKKFSKTSLGFSPKLIIYFIYIIIDLVKPFINWKKLLWIQLRSR